MAKERATQDDVQRQEQTDRGFGFVSSVDRREEPESWAKRLLDGHTPEQRLRVAIMALDQVRHLPAVTPEQQQEMKESPEEIRALISATVDIATRVYSAGAFGEGGELLEQVQRVQGTLNRTASHLESRLLDAAAYLGWVTRSFCEGNEELVIKYSEETAAQCIETAAGAETEVARFVEGAIEFGVNRVKDEGKEQRTGKGRDEDLLDLQSELLPPRHEAIVGTPRSSLAEIRETFEGLHRRMAEQVEGELARLHSKDWGETKDDEKKALAREVTELVKRAGLRLYAEKKDADSGEVRQIPVTIRYHRGVFEMTAAGGVYVDSSSTWPSLRIGSKLLEAKADDPK